nr:MAG TPA: hypothetical protein [Caudoviricetes sp.]
MPTFLCIFNAILTLKSRKININIYKSKIKSQKFEKNILTITKNRIYCKCNHEKS